MKEMVDYIYRKADRAVAQWDRQEMGGVDYFYGMCRGAYFCIDFCIDCNFENWLGVSLDHAMLCHEKVDDIVVRFYQDIGLSVVGIYLGGWEEWMGELV